MLARISPAERIRTQQLHSKNKLYALHAPEVECIGKGKARKPYEFGVRSAVRRPPGVQDVEGTVAYCKMRDGAALNSVAVAGRGGILPLY